MSKNKGFSRVMALVLTICMVVSFAPAAYADVDEEPAVQEEALVAEDNTVDGGDVEVQALARERTISITAPVCNNSDCDAEVTVEQGGKVIATLTKDSDPFTVKASNTSPVTLTAKAGANCGCEFVNWTKNGTTTEAGKDTKLVLKYTGYSISDKTITANFKSSKCVVTYTDGVNGRAFASQSYTVNIGDATPAFDGTPTRDGYEFIGWNPEVTETVSGNTTYVAQWNNVSGKLVVTYTDGMGGKAFADQAYDVYPGEATPAFSGTPSRTGFTFLGWSPEVAETATESVTYTAQWEAPTANKPKKITSTAVDKMQIRAYAEGTKALAASGGEDFSCSPTIYAKGVSYTIGEVEGNDIDGYTTTVTFHFRSGDKFEDAARETFNTNKNFNAVTGWSNWIGNWVYSDTHPADQTLTLNWGKYQGRNAWVIGDGINITAAVANYIKIGLKLERTVTYTDGVNGTAFADQVYTIANGSTAPSFDGTPERKGYVFKGWEPAVDATAKIYADTTYTAQWEEKLYTVTYTDGVDGEEVFEDQVYSVKLDSATPAFDGTPTRANYDFAGWEPEVAETVTGDATYTAKWEPSTKKMPKNITEADVNQMEIRAYAEGTESYRSINEMLSCSPSIHAKGVEYTINPVVGNDVDGYTTSVTFNFKHGDQLEAGAISVFNTQRGLGYYSDWEKWTGNWSYDFDEYTGAAKNGATRPAEQTLTLKWVVTVNPRTGKETGSWKLLKDGEVYANNIKSAVANIIQVNLKLERTVTYTDGVNGAAFADQVYTIRNGSVAPAFDGTPTRAGYKFVGWEPAFDATAKIYADTTYVAQWNALYTVTYTDGVDGEELFADQSYTVENGEATPAFDGTPAREGYVFKGWAPEVSETVTGNATYVAQWNALYTVTYTDGVDGEELFADQSYTVENGEATPAFDGTPAREGYVFKGWAPAVAETVTENVTYVAQWNALYTVTYTDGVDGEELFADQSYTVENGEATPAFDGTPAREGYVFKGWTPAVAETVTENVTYVAQWNALYTVTYTDGVDGEELFADQSYTVENGEATPAFNGTPERAGYTFAGWTPAVAETVTGNVTYTAQWTANDYTLSRDSNGGDKLADVKVTTDKPYGDAVVASPRAGYTEDGWFLVVDKTVTDTEITADSVVKTFGDHGIYLKRSIAPATVTVSEDVTKDYDGKEVTLTASTDEYTGLVYSYQWYKDGEEIAGTTGKTLTVDGNVADSGVYTVKVTVTNAEDSGVVTENESVTAEAEVKVVINKINNSLTYNYNGADEKDSTVETTDSTVTVDADKEITRKGYDFLGWNTKADGTGDSYKSGDELTFADNGNGGEAVTLYAQWKGKEYKLTFKIKEDPDFTEDVKLNFTTKTVVYGEKVGQFPYATRKDHILVWYDKDGKRVDSETVYLVEGDSTYTGVWTEYKPVVATGDSSNIALYAAAMFASLACIGAGVILLRRKREE